MGFSALTSTSTLLFTYSNIARDCRQQMGPVNVSLSGQFVFVSWRWNVKRLFRCGRLSLLGPLCSQDRTVVQRCVFDPPGSSFALLCLTSAESWCCEIECSVRALGGGCETLAIRGRRQEPVLPLCPVKLRCACVAFSKSLPLLLSVTLLRLSPLLKRLGSRCVISGCGFTEELWTLLWLKSDEI